MQEKEFDNIIICYHHSDAVSFKVEVIHKDQGSIFSFEHVYDPRNPIVLRLPDIAPVKDDSALTMCLKKGQLRVVIAKGPDSRISELCTVLKEMITQLTEGRNLNKIKFDKAGNEFKEAYNSLLKGINSTQQVAAAGATRRLFQPATETKAQEGIELTSFKLGA